MVGTASIRSHTERAPSYGSSENIHVSLPPRKQSLTQNGSGQPMVPRGSREGSPQNAGPNAPGTSTFSPPSPRFRYESARSSPKSVASSIRGNISGPILHSSPSCSSLRPSISSLSGADLVQPNASQASLGSGTPLGTPVSGRWPSSSSSARGVVGAHRPSPSMPLNSSPWPPSPSSSEMSQYRMNYTPQPPLPMARSNSSDTFGSNPTPIPKLQRKKSSASLLVGGIGRGLGRATSVLRKASNSSQQPAADLPAFGTIPLNSQPRSLGPTWGRRTKRHGSSTLQDLCEDDDEPMPSGRRGGHDRNEMPVGWVEVLKSAPPADMYKTGSSSATPVSKPPGSGVSLPFNVQHDLHVSADLDGMPDDWITKLKAQGLSEADLLLITAAQKKQRAVPLIKLKPLQAGQPAQPAPPQAQPSVPAPTPALVTVPAAATPPALPTPQTSPKTKAEDISPTDPAEPVAPPAYTPAPVPALAMQRLPPVPQSSAHTASQVHSRQCSAADATIVTVTGAGVKRKPSIISKLLDDLDSVSSRPSRPSVSRPSRSRARSSGEPRVRKPAEAPAHTGQAVVLVDNPVPPPPEGDNEDEPVTSSVRQRTQSQFSALSATSAMSSSRGSSLHRVESRRISVELRGFRELAINGEDGWASSVLAAWDDEPDVAVTRSHVRSSKAPARVVSKRIQRVPELDLAQPQPPALAPSYGVALTPPLESTTTPSTADTRAPIPFYDSPVASASAPASHRSPTLVAPSPHPDSPEVEVVMRRRSKSFDFDPALRATLYSPPPPPPRPPRGNGPRALSGYEVTTVPLATVVAAPIVRSVDGHHRRKSVDSFGVAHSPSSAGSSRCPSSSELDLGTPPLEPPEKAHTKPQKERTPPIRSLGSAVALRALPQPPRHGDNMPNDERPPSSDDIVAMYGDDGDNGDSPSTMASHDLPPFNASTTSVQSIPLRPGHRNQHLQHLQFPVSATSLNLNSPPFPIHHATSEESDGEMGFSPSSFGGSSLPAVSALGLCLTISESHPRSRSHSQSRNSGSHSGSHSRSHSPGARSGKENRDEHDPRDRDLRSSMLSRMGSITSVASSAHSYSLHEVTVHRAYTRVLRRVAEGAETPNGSDMDHGTASSTASASECTAGAMGALEEAAWRVALRERVATG